MVGEKEGSGWAVQVFHPVRALYQHPYWDLPWVAMVRSQRRAVTVAHFDTGVQIGRCSVGAGE